MTSSAAQEVKQNLISTVGGEVTIPDPVVDTRRRGFLLKNGSPIASVKDSVFEIAHNDFQNRITWDRFTGRFTIILLQHKDSGVYAVAVNETLVFFMLNVYGT